MRVNSLKIYDDLVASGTPQAQAHAQAMAIIESSTVSIEDLVKMEKDIKNDFETSQKEIRNDFEKSMQKIITQFDLFSQRIEKDLKWMRIIGGAMTVAFLSNGLQGWFK